MKHSHYKKPVAGLQFVDVYRVLALFGVTDPCLQHAVKKLLVAGGRGAKDISQDVQEAIDTLQRWQEMRAEDAAVVKDCFTTEPAMPADFGQQHTIEPSSLIDDESPRQQAIGQNGNGGEHYASTQTNWPDWSTHRVVRIDSALSGSQFAKEFHGAYLSVKGKAFNMNRWRVVEQRP